MEKSHERLRGFSEPGQGKKFTGFDVCCVLLGLFAFEHFEMVVKSLDVVSYLF